LTSEIDFEKSFEDFLQSDNFDGASDVMFLLARAAFLSGWRSAHASERDKMELKAIKGKGKTVD